MKKKLNFRLCLFLASVLLLTSCRHDYLPEKETYSNSSAFHLTSKRISLNEAKHKSKLVTELDNAETRLKKLGKTNLQGRVINYGNGVSIDTDHVTYIENGPNFHTYTFYINRENAPADAPVENLVLVPLSDGSYKELLVSYQLTPQEKETLAKGGFVDTHGKMNITELAQGTYNPMSRGMTSCGWEEEATFVTVCSEDQHGMWNIGEWKDCKADRKPGWHTTMVYRCNFIYDESDPGGGWWANEGGATDTGGGTQEPWDGTTDPCNGNGVATGPLDPNTGVGEGGCSGVPTVIEMPNLTDPCEKIKKVGKDDVTKKAMKNLKTKVNDNKEHIYLLWEDNAGALQDDIYSTGPVNGGGVNFNFSSGDQFSALLHSHYDRPDMLSTFSFDDFITVCNLMYFNAIKDQDSFVMGVVTASGTQYMMVIDNPAKLASFASQMFVNGVYNEQNGKIYERFYNDAVYSTNTIANNELGLALFLESQNIGLKLMKGDDQMENWQKFTKDKQGNIVPVNCN